MCVCCICCIRLGLIRAQGLALKVPEAISTKSLQAMQLGKGRGDAGSTCLLLESSVHHIARREQSKAFQHRCGDCGLLPSLHESMDDPSGLRAVVPILRRGSQHFNLTYIEQAPSKDNPLARCLPKVLLSSHCLHLPEHCPMCTAP